MAQHLQFFAKDKLPWIHLREFQIATNNLMDETARRLLLDSQVSTLWWTLKTSLHHDYSQFKSNYYCTTHIRSIFETLINFHAPTFMILAVLKNATQMFPAQRLWRFIYGETQLRQRCPIRVSSRILRIVASEKNHRYRTPRLSACLGACMVTQYI